MGARHLVVVDGELAAVGVITRADMNEHRLAHFWHEEVRNLIEFPKIMLEFILLVFLTFLNIFGMNCNVHCRENKCKRT